MSEQEKKEWKRLYFKTSLFANSFYYEHKYGSGESNVFLENFFKKSRNKMFGHIEMPKNFREFN